MNTRHPNKKKIQCLIKHSENTRIAQRDGKVFCVEKEMKDVK